MLVADRHNVSEWCPVHRHEDWSPAVDVQRTAAGCRKLSDVADAQATQARDWAATRAKCTVDSHEDADVWTQRCMGIAVKASMEWSSTMEAAHGQRLCDGSNVDFNAQLGEEDGCYWDGASGIWEPDAPEV